MKFCQNLKRVVEISDPEWAPYWINYKHLKKLIKGIVSSTAATLPAGDNISRGNVASQQPESAGTGVSADSQAESSSTANSNAQPVAARAAAAPPIVEHQSQGDETSERRQAVGQQSEDPSVGRQPQHGGRPADGDMLDQIGKSPGERAFFKLLHSEVKKSAHFFEQAQREYVIREERVRKGLEIIKNQQGETDLSSADERWSRCAQSIFRLYRELLLLETFAIMTYCGFSKILKKHDKNTGFRTKNAFMAKIVNQSNFVNYPQLLQMINRCEQLYEEVSTRLMEEGKDEFNEDQRLFIHMVQRLNSQVVGGGNTAEAAAIAKGAKAVKPQPANPSASNLKVPASRSSPLSEQEAWKAQSLKELVAENDTDASTARTNDDDSDSDSDAEDAKPKASTRGSETSGGGQKRASSEEDGGSPSKVAKRQQS